ncbi:putative 50S small subunit ribosomal protein L19 [Blattamonas nauphoetae]|uniref:50S small subunit ribosomal protein L19 n=1 Tax=Blattamonas nauphoetae TaxID=2049346 RepID=A0ABQ9XDX4_9EUKA|nr:putative 50S small subunit ribosomal protein L19 [Blattamonas nauphoetae]
MPSSAPSEYSETEIDSSGRLKKPKLQEELDFLFESQKLEQFLPSLVNLIYSKRSSKSIRVIYDWIRVKLQTTPEFVPDFASVLRQQAAQLSITVASADQHLILAYIRWTIITLQYLKDEGESANLQLRLTEVLVRMLHRFVRDASFNQIKNTLPSLCGQLKIAIDYHPTVVQAIFKSSTVLSSEAPIGAITLITFTLTNLVVLLSEFDTQTHPTKKAQKSTRFSQKDVDRWLEPYSTEPESSFLSAFTSLFRLNQPIPLALFQLQLFKSSPHNQHKNPDFSILEQFSALYLLKRLNQTPQFVSNLLSYIPTAFHQNPHNATTIIKSILTTSLILPTISLPSSFLIPLTAAIIKPIEAIPADVMTKKNDFTADQTNLPFSLLDSSFPSSPISQPVHLSSNLANTLPSLLSINIFVQLLQSMTASDANTLNFAETVTQLSQSMKSRPSTRLLIVAAIECLAISVHTLLPHSCDVSTFSPSALLSLSNCAQFFSPPKITSFPLDENKSLTLLPHLISLRSLVLSLFPSSSIQTAQPGEVSTILSALGVINPLVLHFTTILSDEQLSTIEYTSSSTSTSVAAPSQPAAQPKGKKGGAGKAQAKSQPAASESAPSQSPTKLTSAGFVEELLSFYQHSLQHMTPFIAQTSPTPAHAPVRHNRASLLQSLLLTLSTVALSPQSILIQGLLDHPQLLNLIFPFVSFSQTKSAQTISLTSSITNHPLCFMEHVLQPILVLLISHPLLTRTSPNGVEKHGIDLCHQVVSTMFGTPTSPLSLSSPTNVLFSSASILSLNTQQSAHLSALHSLVLLPFAGYKQKDSEQDTSESVSSSLILRSLYASHLGQLQGKFSPFSLHNPHPFISSLVSLLFHSNWRIRALPSYYLDSALSPHSDVLQSERSAASVFRSSLLHSLFASFIFVDEMMIVNHPSVPASYNIPSSVLLRAIVAVLAGTYTNPKSIDGLIEETKEKDTGKENDVSHPLLTSEQTLSLLLLSHFPCLSDPSFSPTFALSFLLQHSPSSHPSQKKVVTEDPKQNTFKASLSVHLPFIVDSILKRRNGLSEQDLMSVLCADGLLFIEWAEKKRAMANQLSLEKKALKKEQKKEKDDKKGKSDPQPAPQPVKSDFPVLSTTALQSIQHACQNALRSLVVTQSHLHGELIGRKTVETLQQSVNQIKIACAEGSGKGIQEASDKKFGMERITEYGLRAVDNGIHADKMRQELFLNRKKEAEERVRINKEEEAHIQRQHQAALDNEARVAEKARQKAEQEAQNAAAPGKDKKSKNKSRKPKEEVVETPEEREAREEKEAKERVARKAREEQERLEREKEEDAQIELKRFIPLTEDDKSVLRTAFGDVELNANVKRDRTQKGLYSVEDEKWERQERAKLIRQQKIDEAREIIHTKLAKQKQYEEETLSELNCINHTFDMLTILSQTDDSIIAPSSATLASLAADCLQTRFFSEAAEQTVYAMCLNIQPASMRKQLSFVLPLSFCRIFTHIGAIKANKGVIEPVKEEEDDDDDESVAKVIDVKNYPLDVQIKRLFIVFEGSTGMKMEKLGVKRRINTLDTASFNVLFPILKALLLNQTKDEALKPLSKIAFHLLSSHCSLPVTPMLPQREMIETLITFMQNQFTTYTPAQLNDASAVKLLSDPLFLLTHSAVNISALSSLINGMTSNIPQMRQISVKTAQLALPYLIVQPSGTRDVSRRSKTQQAVSITENEWRRNCRIAQTIGKEMKGRTTRDGIHSLANTFQQFIETHSLEERHSFITQIELVSCIYLLCFDEDEQTQTLAGSLWEKVISMEEEEEERRVKQVTTNAELAQLDDATITSLRLATRESTFQITFLHILPLFALLASPHQSIRSISAATIGNLVTQSEDDEDDPSFTAIHISDCLLHISLQSAEMDVEEEQLQKMRKKEEMVMLTTDIVGYYESTPELDKLGKLFEAKDGETQAINGLTSPYLHPISISIKEAEDKSNFEHNEPTDTNFVPFFGSLLRSFHLHIALNGSVGKRNPSLMLLRNGCAHAFGAISEAMATADKFKNDSFFLSSSPHDSVSVSLVSFIIDRTLCLSDDIPLNQQTMVESLTKVIAEAIRAESTSKNITPDTLDELTLPTQFLVMILAHLKNATEIDAGSRGDRQISSLVRLTEALPIFFSSPDDKQIDKYQQALPSASSTSVAASFTLPSTIVEGFINEQSSDYHPITILLSTILSLHSIPSQRVQFYASHAVTVLLSAHPSLFSAISEPQSDRLLRIMLSTTSSYPERKGSAFALAAMAATEWEEDIDSDENANNENKRKKKSGGGMNWFVKESDLMNVILEAAIGRPGKENAAVSREGSLVFIEVLSICVGDCVQPILPKIVPVLLASLSDQGQARDGKGNVRAAASDAVDSLLQYSLSPFGVNMLLPTLIDIMEGRNTTVSDLILDDKVEGENGKKKKKELSFMSSDGPTAKSTGKSWRSMLGAIQMAQRIATYLTSIGTPKRGEENRSDDDNEEQDEEKKRRSEAARSHLILSFSSTILPRLTTILVAETHPQIQKAVKETLSRVGESVENDRIRNSMDKIIDALSDIGKTESVLKYLFVATTPEEVEEKHQPLDAASLSLIYPLVLRSLRSRTITGRIAGLQTVGLFGSLVSATYLVPYMPSIIPLITRFSLVDVPQIRSEAATTLASLVRAIGEENCCDIVNWLLNVINAGGVLPPSNDDESKTQGTIPKSAVLHGAASGLAAVIGVQGSRRLKALFPTLVRGLYNPTPTVREGYLNFWSYLPSVMENAHNEDTNCDFRPFLPLILPHIIFVAGDVESESCRLTAVNAARVMISIYGFQVANYHGSLVNADKKPKRAGKNPKRYDIKRSPFHQILNVFLTSLNNPTTHPPIPSSLDNFLQENANETDDSQLRQEQAEIDAIEARMKKERTGGTGHVESGWRIRYTVLRLLEKLIEVVIVFVLGQKDTFDHEDDSDYEDEKVDIDVDRKNANKLLLKKLKRRMDNYEKKESLRDKKKGDEEQEESASVEDSSDIELDSGDESDHDKKDRKQNEGQVYTRQLNINRLLHACLFPEDSQRKLFFGTLYVSRFDPNRETRTQALRLWKDYVLNPPKMVKMLMPTVIQIVSEILSSSSGPTSQSLMEARDQGLRKKIALEEKRKEREQRIKDREAARERRRLEAEEKAKPKELADDVLADVSSSESDSIFVVEQSESEIDSDDEEMLLTDDDWKKEMASACLTDLTTKAGDQLFATLLPAIQRDLTSSSSSSAAAVNVRVGACISLSSLLTPPPAQPGQTVQSLQQHKQYIQSQSNMASIVNSIKTALVDPSHKVRNAGAIAFASFCQAVGANQGIQRIIPTLVSVIGGKDGGKSNEIQSLNAVEGLKSLLSLSPSTFSTTSMQALTQGILPILLKSPLSKGSLRALMRLSGVDAITFALGQRISSLLPLLIDTLLREEEQLEKSGITESQLNKEDSAQFLARGIIRQVARDQGRWVVDELEHELERLMKLDLAEKDSKDEAKIAEAQKRRQRELICVLLLGSVFERESSDEEEEDNTRIEGQAIIDAAHLVLRIGLNQQSQSNSKLSGTDRLLEAVIQTLVLIVRSFNKVDTLRFIPGLLQTLSVNERKIIDSTADKVKGSSVSKMERRDRLLAKCGKDMKGQLQRLALQIELKQRDWTDYISPTTFQLSLLSQTASIRCLIDVVLTSLSLQATQALPPSLGMSSADLSIACCKCLAIIVRCSDPTALCPVIPLLVGRLIRMMGDKLTLNVKSQICGVIVELMEKKDAEEKTLADQPDVAAMKEAETALLVSLRRTLKLQIEDTTSDTTKPFETSVTTRKTTIASSIKSFAPQLQSTLMRALQTVSTISDPQASDSSIHAEAIRVKSTVCLILLIPHIVRVDPIANELRTIVQTAHPSFTTTSPLNSPFDLSLRLLTSVITVHSQKLSAVVKESLFSLFALTINDILKRHQQSTTQMAVITSIAADGMAGLCASMKGNEMQICLDQILTRDVPFAQQQKQQPTRTIFKNEASWQKNEGQCCGEHFSLRFPSLTPNVKDSFAKTVKVLCGSETSERIEGKNTVGPVEKGRYLQALTDGLSLTLSEDPQVQAPKIEQIGLNVENMMNLMLSASESVVLHYEEMMTANETGKTSQYLLKETREKLRAQQLAQFSLNGSVLTLATLPEIVAFIVCGLDEKRDSTLQSLATAACEILVHPLIHSSDDFLCLFGADGSFEEKDCSRDAFVISTSVHLLLSTLSNTLISSTTNDSKIIVLHLLKHLSTTAARTYPALLRIIAAEVGSAISRPDSQGTLAAKTLTDEITKILKI